MLKHVSAVHKRVYGESSYTLAADHKSIGEFQKETGQIKEAVESLLIAEKHSKLALSQVDDESEIQDVGLQLLQIQMVLYHWYVHLFELDKAFEVNNDSLNYNIQVFGKDDLHVANNYFENGQILLRKLKLDDALEYANKANAMLDTKPNYSALILARYRTLSARIHMAKKNNIQAILDLKAAISVCVGISRLAPDLERILKLQAGLESWLTDEEIKEIEKVFVKKEDEKDKYEEFKKEQQSLKQQYKQAALKGLKSNQGMLKFTNLLELKRLILVDFTYNFVIIGNTGPQIQNLNRNYKKTMKADVSIFDTQNLILII